MVKGGPMDVSPIGLKKNWVTSVGGLPLYIRAVAHAFIRSGTPESEAIHRAVGVVHNWADGHDGHGHAVSAETIAKARAAITEWDAKRARSKAAHLSNGDRMPDTIDLAGMQAGDLLDAMLKRYKSADGPTKAKMQPGMVGLAKKLGRTKELPADCQPSSASMSNVRFTTDGAGNFRIRMVGGGGGGGSNAPPVIDLAAFTADQRKQMAAKGQAMKGGGFPIPNTGFLSKAIHAYGRAKNKKATRAHIKSRAKALNASHMLPSSWTGKPKNSGVLTTSMSAERLQGLVDLANTNPRIRKVVIHKIRQKRLRNAKHPVKMRRINPMPKGKRL